MNGWLNFLWFVLACIGVVYLSKKIADSERVRRLIEKHPLKFLALSLVVLWFGILYFSFLIRWNVVGIILKALMLSSLGYLTFTSIKNIKRKGRLEFE